MVASPGSSGSSGDVWPAPGEPLNNTLELQGVVLEESTVLASPLLPYVRMLVSLVEGVAFSRQAIVDLLLRTMRQHSLSRRTRVDYVLAFLHQHPP